MNYSAKSVVLFASLLSLGLGCANSLEMRTISQWMAELEEEDLAQVRDHSSDKFDELAFPMTARAEPFAAVKVLKLPKGRLNIIKVEGDETEKKILVELEEKKTVDLNGKKTKRTITRKLVFKLIPDQKSGKWVVDDVFRPEKIRGGDTAYRSIAQQMNLLLAVQEFDYLWTQGDREEVLDSCTPQLAKLLGELSPANLNQILIGVHGKKPLSGKFNPQARMAQDTAEVSFRKNGRTIVTAFRRLNGRWLVDDVAAKSAAQSRSGQFEITSIKDLSAIQITANAFRAAYASNDKRALAEICTVQFFEGALEASDLRAFPLPNIPDQDGKNTDIKIVGGRADFVAKNGQELLQISLIKNEDDNPGAPRTYHVDDVTVFDWNQRQEKKLAAVFTAHQAMLVYSAALAERDLNMLEFLSTRDFQLRAWQRLNSDTIQAIPLHDIPSAPPVVENTVFQGPLTEITVNQGGKPVTYVMRALRGNMKVDDVLFPASGRPDSLKQTIELLVPIQEFASGFETGNLELLAQNSSRDLNHTVWSQCNTFPRLAVSPAVHLRTPLKRVENTNPEQVQVILGDQNLGAVVWLLKEHDAYRVNDVRIIRGPDQLRDQVQLKRHIRLALAEGNADRVAPQKVQPALLEVGGEDSFPESLGRAAPVQQASGSTPHPEGP